MKEIGTFEAKTHLSALLDEVARGAEVVITRRGVAVARLVPAGSPRRVGGNRLVLR
jgi:prevent-host-death family protein